MHRRVSILLLTFALMGLITACGGTSTASTTSQPVATTTTITSSPTSSTSSGGTCAAVPAGSKPYTIDSAQSQASYEVQEKFLNRPLPNQAIGKTSTIQGGLALQVNGAATITALKVTVNLQTLTSDSARRDGAIQGHWLESNTYPLATFVVKSPQTVASSYSSGQPVTFKLNGDMTVHSTTHAETFTVQGKLSGNTITGTAKSLVYMKDFGFSAPSIFGLLTVKDGATVTFNFTANQGGCPALS